MSLRDEHLAKALKHAPDSDLAPSDATRKTVLDYANKAIQTNKTNAANKPGQKAHKHWLTGWLPDMKNWQWAGMSSVAVALLAVIMLREQLPEVLTQRDDTPTVLEQNQAKQMPENLSEKEARAEVDAASATMIQEEAPASTTGLEAKAKAREKLGPPTAPEIVDKTVVTAAPEIVAPAAPEIASLPESKAETAPAQQELAKQDAEKDTPKDNSIVAETRARTEAAPAPAASAPASDVVASSSQKSAPAKPAAAAKKSATLDNGSEGARLDASATGVAKAKQDIQAGVLRILVGEWPSDKPMDKLLMDEETGYRVELVESLAPDELAAYNQTMRDWFKTQH